MTRILVACGALAAATAWAQPPASPAAPDAPAASPPAPGVRPDLARLGFLAGDWRGSIEGDDVEEQWSEPAGAGIMGSFRWLKQDGTLNMLELLSISAEDSGVLLRLRHFNTPALNPWKSETEAATTLRLTESGPARALFTNVDPAGGLESVVYESAEPARLAIDVNFRAAANRAPLNFRLTRHDSRPAAPVAAADAKAVYERFKSLAGDWTGTSTKGWKETITYKTIAGGSAVLETSFDAHPDETMITMIHPDGDRLLLTHYCVAKNQPRLVLSRVEDDGKTVTFEFLDGTNLPTRDRGHMDKVVMKFIDDDHFTSRWTWFQQGEESWMEEIVHERTRGASNAPELGSKPDPHAGHR